MDSRGSSDAGSEGQAVETEQHAAASQRAQTDCQTLTVQQLAVATSGERNACDDSAFGTAVRSRSSSHAGGDRDGEVSLGDVYGAGKADEGDGRFIIPSPVEVQPVTTRRLRNLVTLAGYKGDYSVHLFLDKNEQIAVDRSPAGAGDQQQRGGVFLAERKAYEDHHKAASDQLMDVLDSELPDDESDDGGDVVDGKSAEL